VKIAASAAELAACCTEILAMRFGGQPPAALFLTAKKDIRRELYLGIVMDRRCKQPVVILSAEGGVEINEVARRDAGRVARLAVDPAAGLQPYSLQYLFDRAGIPAELTAPLGGLIEKLYALFRQYDCLLAEINPLAVETSGELTALDAKIEVDDNALYRHPDIEALRDAMSTDPLVREARGFHFLYIPVDARGTIGVISNGSGMIMSSMDMLARHGRKVACALDLGGGATAERIREAARIVLSNPAVRLVFVNIFGGITRCEEVAGGIVRAVKESRAGQFVVRMEGTNKEKGLAICTESPEGIRLVDGLEGAMEAIAAVMDGGPGKDGRR